MRKDYIYTIRRIVYTFWMTFFANFVFIMDYKPSYVFNFENDMDGFSKFLNELNVSIQNFEIKSLILVVFIFYFFYHSYFHSKNNLRKYIFSFGISFIFVILTLIGKSFYYNNTLDLIYSTNCQILKSIILGIGYLFLYCSICLSVLNINFKWIQTKEGSGKIIRFFKRHHIIFMVVFLAMMWLPVAIVYYPATATGDTVDSLAQFFHIRDLCWSAKAINLVNQNVIINKHHSVFFTVILGEIVKLGKVVSSYELGMFMFVILQILLLIIVFTFLMDYLIKSTVPDWIVILSILFLGISPIVSSYAITVIKDTSGAIFVLLYNILLLQLVRDYRGFMKKKGTIILFMISILMILMIKSNGFNIIIISYLCLLFCFGKSRIKMRKLFTILVVPMILFLSYDRILLTGLEVTGTNKKEEYSIFFMQIARVANRGGLNISKGDVKVIDKVLNYNSIRKYYDPDLSDNVKNTYKKEATSEDLRAFWKVYLKYFIKYPKTYIASFVNSTYAYFFPEIGETDGIRNLDERIGKKSVFNLELNNKFTSIRQSYQIGLSILKKIPLFSFFNHLAFYDWFLIFSIMYVIWCKNYKYLVPMISLVFILSSCLISPVNGSFRYILSIVFSMPLIVGIDYFTFSEKIEREEVGLNKK